MELSQTYLVSFKYLNTIMKNMGSLNLDEVRRKFEMAMLRYHNERSRNYGLPPESKTKTKIDPYQL